MADFLSHPHTHDIFLYYQVYDGIDENADLLETFCGDERPPIIRSFSNSLLVRFYSDWLLNGRGFTAAYTQVNGMCFF